MRYPKILTCALLLIVTCGSMVCVAMPVPDGDEDPAAAGELPLPAVPAELKTPAERAAYIIGHFWEAMDFRDTVRSRSSAFMEQNFVNFISLFPHADTSVLYPAVHVLMTRAGVDKKAFVLLADIAEKYLGESGSPVRDENYRILFLQEVVNSGVLESYEKLRARYRLEAAMKNRPGTVASDFGIIARDGKKTSLRKVVSGDYTLLLFYDPDCAHCAEVVDMLLGSETIGQTVKSGRLKIVAVYPDGLRWEWEPSKNSFPDSWTVGLDTSGVQENELYALGDFPALYLLDKNCRVILKEPLPEEFVEYVKNEIRQK